MFSKELLKGTLKTIVLHLLEEQGKMYGYEIARYVRERSEGQLELTEGALYPTLHKLEADGLVATEKVQVGHRTRKYYRLTALGTEAAGRKREEFALFTATMRMILTPKWNT